MEYNAHALGNYHGYTMTNSKEALLNSYKTGFRFFEVDIQRTSDGHFVAYHFWSKADAERLQIPFDEKKPVPNLNTFRQYRYLSKVFDGGLTPLTLQDIFDFMKTHQDITVMFDFLAGFIDKDNRALMNDFAAAFTDKDIRDRSIIETYSKQNAIYLYEAGFANIQPFIDIADNMETGLKTITEITNFVKQFNIKNMSISQQKIQNDYEDILLLKSLSVRIFSPTGTTKKWGG